MPPGVSQASPSPRKRAWQAAPAAGSPVGNTILFPGVAGILEPLMPSSQVSWAAHLVDFLSPASVPAQGWTDEERSLRWLEKDVYVLSWVSGCPQVGLLYQGAGLPPEPRAPEPRQGQGPLSRATGLPPGPWGDKQPQMVQWGHKMLFG